MFLFFSVMSPLIDFKFIFQLLKKRSFKFKFTNYITEQKQHNKI